MLAQCCMQYMSFLESIVDQKLHLTSQAKTLLTGYSIHFIEYHIHDPVPDVVLDMFNRLLSNEKVIQLAYPIVYGLRTRHHI